MMEQTITESRPIIHAAPTFYELLKVPTDANADDITAAYRRQRGLYELSEAQAQDPAFVKIAEERCGALDDAYAVLSDPKQRAAYNQSIGLHESAASERRGVSTREVLYAVGGVLVGVLILASLWSALGRDAMPNVAVSEVSYAAPPINLRTLDGGQFNLEEYRGKVVLVNFWGTWCEPCKEETPALQAAHERFADDGLVIVGVDLFDAEKTGGIPDAEAEAKVRAFTEQYGVTYPIALDQIGSVAQAYKLYPIPVSYFIDREGTVRFIRIGGLTTKDVEELFGKL
jgi:cytochrome c biogenesis protein CcmG, thiol:disulfide interchange protein DsbE